MGSKNGKLTQTVDSGDSANLIARRHRGSNARRRTNERKYRVHSSSIPKETGAAPAPSFSVSREWSYLVLLVLLLCATCLKGIAHGELHFMTDETRHAMNGVFVLDFLRDFPRNWPIQYSYDYYGKYPAVAIGHWPVGFYLFEAVFFAIFGISPWVSRLAILPFAILAALFWYRVVRYYSPPPVAFFSTIIYGCLPSLFLYQQATMLEIPCLALSLGAIYCWLKLLQTERPGYIYGVAFFSASAMLTKQTAIFLVPLFLLHLVVERKWSLLRSKHLYLGAALAGAVILPWYVAVLRMHPAAIRQAVGSFRSARHPESLLTQLLYYPRTLPSEIGLPLLLLSATGILLALFSIRNRPPLRLMLTWIVTCYVSFTLLGDRSPRYIQPWLLPLIFFAVLAVWELLSRHRGAALACLIGLGAAFYLPSFTYERPFVVGCADAALFLAQQPDSDLIFYNGQLNGDFIFFVRKFDPEKRRMVLRERTVSAQAIADTLGTSGDPPSPADIERMLMALGVRYAVTDDGEFSEQTNQIARALRSPSFELIKEIPIQSNDFRVAGVKLRVYRSRSTLAGTVSEVHVPMTSLPHSLHLSIARLSGHPWPARH